QARSADVTAFELAIKGLNGGHSGMDIILGRANANKLLFRLLKVLVKKCGVEVATINGGSLRNAIPREAFALITVPSTKLSSMEKHIQAFFAETKAELALVEPEYKVNTTSAKLPKEVMTKSSITKLINLIYGLPNGVIRMSDSIHGLVETSTNMAIVKADKGVAEISCLLRSSVDSAKADLVEAMDSVIRLAGAKGEFTGGYPGWKPNPSSPILKTMQATYKTLYKTTPKITAIHAGLECGLLGGVYPNLDMISFGPTISSPHSPDEKVNIASVQKFWDFLVATLAAVPKK
ncbi:MAG: M20/M25/M40 family metallo-hydrolase, partial [Bacteroidales bacterium]